MTTQEFIDSYKLNKDLMKHIKQNYVPYLEKIARCEKIVNIKSYNSETKQLNKNELKIIKNHDEHIDKLANVSIYINNLILLFRICHLFRMEHFVKFFRC